VGQDTTPGRLLRVTRAFTVVFAVVQVTVAIGGQWLSKTVVENVLTIAGFTTGITLGVFLLGLLAPRASQKAALLAFGLGLLVMSAVAFGTSLAWPWYTVVGSTATLAIGVLASRAWPARPRREPAGS
jgi:Na+/proline symporter